MGDKKNYWAEVTKVFGVELGEKFNLIQPNGEITKYSPYTIEKDGLKDNENADANMLIWLLLDGTYTIQNKPWKPKDGNKYWYVVVGSDGIACIGDYTWSNHSVDMLNYKSGNCFRTEEEVGQNMDKIISMLKSDKVFEY